MGASAGRRRVYAAALAGHVIRRHCERSEAIQNPTAERFWIASSQELLAMTLERGGARRRYDLLLPATAATGAGLSGFWNINNGRKMTRP